MLGRLLFIRTGYSVPREFRRARRHDQVLEVQRVRDVNRRQPLRVQLVEVQIHHDLAVLAPERKRHRRALHGGERRADEVVPEIEDFLLLERLAAQPELENRHARRVVLQDLRRKCPGRHVADLRPGTASRSATARGPPARSGGRTRGRPRRSGVDCDSTCSTPTTFAVTARSKFVTIRLSISSGVSPLYCQTMLTTGRSMYGKDVHRHRRDRETARDGDEQRHDDEGIGAPEGEPDDPHGAAVSYSTARP